MVDGTAYLILNIWDSLISNEQGSPALPYGSWPIGIAVLTVIGTAAIWLAGRRLPEPGGGGLSCRF
jgi:hypothetical protein